MRNALITVFVALCMLPATAGETRRISFGVLDPLAKKNACDCIAGFAQRDYDLFSKYLRRVTGLIVKPSFGSGLSDVRVSEGHFPELIIGKVGEVELQARKAALAVTKLGMLTDKKGKTTFQGVFIVRQGDSAKTVADLAGRKVVLGPVGAVEKHGAALVTLRKAGVVLGQPLNISESCTEAGVEVVSKDADAAVISDYALALLLGCKAVAKGELRVIGKTDPQPFIGVYVTERFPAGKVPALKKALADMAEDMELLEGMETRGFVSESQHQASSTWPDWLGPARNGLSLAVPAALPETPNILWKKELQGQSHGGVSTDGTIVLLSDKSEDGALDRWVCLDAKTGEEIWVVQNLADEDMDFTNAPRATPVIDGDRVFLLNAFGLLQSVNKIDGSVFWKHDLLAEYQGNLPTWGYCCTPYIINGKVIVTGCSTSAFLVAYDLEGNLVWKTSGLAAGYGNFLLHDVNGVKQLIGFDENSAGGWDVSSGKRLWSVVVSERDDFYVPTPLAVGRTVALFTETGGSRIYDFSTNGVLKPKPLALNESVCPDVSSPVWVSGRIWCCTNEGTYCLDATTLKILWQSVDEAMAEAGTIFGGNDRVCIVYKNGHVALLPARIGKKGRPVLRNYFPDADVWAQPAIIQGRMFVRTDSAVYCLEI